MGGVREGSGPGPMRRTMVENTYGKTVERTHEETREILNAVSCEVWQANTRMCRASSGGRAGKLRGGCGACAREPAVLDSDG
jgi:hypothetical protein